MVILTFLQYWRFAQSNLRVPIINVSSLQDMYILLGMKQRVINRDASRKIELMVTLLLSFEIRLKARFERH